MSIDDEKSTLVEHGESGKHRKLSLLVISEGHVSTHTLPDDGDLTIGRSSGCEVFVDVPTLSRRHFVLKLGDPLRIGALPTSNPTRVRGRDLASGEIAEIAIGEVIEIGSTSILLQRQNAARRPRRVWTHDAFEARLEDECSRAENTGGGRFALVRLHAAGPDVAELLATVLRPGDVLAEYGPDEYEALLLDVDAAAAERMVGQIDVRLHRMKIRPRHGTAAYPTDGRSPEVLMSKACDRLARKTSAPGVPLTLDPTMLRLDRLVDRLAAGTINVLLLGETGVGKEIFAEKIHRRSPRADKPLLKLNCAALSEQLLESELFGHEKGAFTGAAATKPGLLESADGGTVFLDELGELPASLQAKLLRVLEDRAIMRVGGLKPRPIDVRFVAATNRDLEAEIARGTFRKDLFYRLSAATLMIPPLRERSAEIEPLARLFLEQFAKQMNRPSPAMLPSALAILHGYDWPGNIRELRNVIERAVLLTGDEPIGPELLPVEKMTTTLPPEGTSKDLRSRRADYERQVVIDALERAGGNQTAAARLLGIARRTLITRMHEYGLPRPRDGKAK